MIKAPVLLLCFALVQVAPCTSDGHDNANVRRRLLQLRMYNDPTSNRRHASSRGWEKDLQKSPLIGSWTKILSNIAPKADCVFSDKTNKVFTVSSSTCVKTKDRLRNKRGHREPTLSPECSSVIVKTVSECAQRCRRMEACHYVFSALKFKAGPFRHCWFLTHGIVDSSANAGLGHMVGRCSMYVRVHPDDPDDVREPLWKPHHEADWASSYKAKEKLRNSVRHLLPGAKQLAMPSSPPCVSADLHGCVRTGSAVRTQAKRGQKDDGTRAFAGGKSNRAKRKLKTWRQRYIRQKKERDAKIAEAAKKAGNLAARAAACSTAACEKRRTAYLATPLPTATPTTHSPNVAARGHTGMATPGLFPSERNVAQIYQEMDNELTSKAPSALITWAPVAIVTIPPRLLTSSPTKHFHRPQGMSNTAYEDLKHSLHQTDRPTFAPATGFPTFAPATGFPTTEPTAMPTKGHVAVGSVHKGWLFKFGNGACHQSQGNNVYTHTSLERLNLPKLWIWVKQTEHTCRAKCLKDYECQGVDIRPDGRCVGYKWGKGGLYGVIDSVDTTVGAACYVKQTTPGRFGRERATQNCVCKGCKRPYKSILKTSWEQCMLYCKIHGLHHSVARQDERARHTCVIAEYIRNKLTWRGTCKLYSHAAQFLLSVGSAAPSLRNCYCPNGGCVQPLVGINI